jgi:hypothetical protein
MRTLCALSLGMLLLAGTASAQKVTETLKCGKPNPDQTHSMPAGDAPDHVYNLSHTTCTYPKPGTLAGLQAKDGADTIFTEIKGNRLEWNGMFVETYSNGDKLFFSHHGNGTLKNNVFDSGKDFYEVTGGTGKLKNYKGNGSCTIKGAPDGTAEDVCSGEYVRKK